MIDHSKSDNNPMRIGTPEDSRPFWVISALLLLCSLMLIWFDIVGLRYGDYSARLVISNSMRSGIPHFGHDIWLHIWPPLPFLLNRWISEIAVFMGLSTTVFIKIILSLYSVCFYLSVLFIRKIVLHFSPDANPLYPVLLLFTIPLAHVIGTSIASQAITLPLLLAGFWLFVSRFDQQKSSYWAATVFLLANLIRADTVLYSGMLSFMLLGRRQWREFIVFNSIAGGFFIVHQVILGINGARSYFSFGNVYDYSNVTLDEKVAFLGRQLTQTFNVATPNVAWLLSLGVLILYVASLVYLFRFNEAIKSRSSRWALLLWSGGLVFVIGFPLITENGMGRHARDYLFGSVVMCIAVGLSLSTLVRGKLANTGLLCALVILNGYAAYSAIPVRQAPDDIRKIAAWIRANTTPEDSIVFESDWSHYLSATTAHIGKSNQHWTYAKGLYQIEMRYDPCLNIPTVDEAPVYTQLVTSAAVFLESNQANYIVAPAIDRPDRLRDKENARSLHRLRPGYLLSHMTPIDESTRTLQFPSVMTHTYHIEKVYDGGGIHIWKISQTSLE